MEKAFCEHCRKKVHFSIKERMTKEEVVNIEFEYKEKYAVCDICKGEMYIGEIHDKNLQSYSDAFGKASLE